MAAFFTAYVVITQQHGNILTCVYSQANSTLLNNNGTKLNKELLKSLPLIVLHLISYKFKDGRTGVFCDVHGQTNKNQSRIKGIKICFPQSQK